MDKIYRKISLEDFKNRFSNEENNVFGTDWGGVVTNDYLIEDDSPLSAVAEKIPLVDTNRLRFGTMLSLHTWLANVIENSEFYKLCMRNGNKIWTLYTYSFDDDYDEEDENFKFKGVYSEIPASEDEFDVEDIIWVTPEADEILKRFLVDSSEDQSLVLVRIDKFMDVFEAAKRNVQETTGICYANVDIMLTTNCNEVGKYTIGVKMWEPNKEYYGGEYAFSPIDGKIYHLDIGSGDTDSSEIFNENETWVAAEEEIDISTATAYTESRLKTLKRTRRSYDENGDELPFYYYYYADTVELEYITGVTYNITTDGNDVYGDVITNITINETGNGTSAISFTYLIGTKINESDENVVSYEGGVIYEEAYEVTRDSYSFRLTHGSVLITVPYYNIHFDKELEGYRPDDVEDGKCYARITFDTSIYNIDSGVPYIMEESMVGITDVKQSGTASVERGSAAAFELHNILGECRTMEDLEKYRNDFFTIKNDEKQ